jgi:hypothetical protein
MGDGREKHPVCPKCRELKIPTTYWCDVNCPGNPGAWQRHAPVHKAVRKLRKEGEDGGVVQQRQRETAERQARRAAQTGDAYDELLAEGVRYGSKNDWRRAARACREAIALRPDRPEAYHNLGVALGNSGHHVEAAQRFLEAKERSPVGSADWAQTTAGALGMLRQEACAEVAKPEWWIVAQGAVGEGGEGGAGRLGNHRDAGYGAEREECRLGGGASLGGGAQGGGRALRAGCGAVPCSGAEKAQLAGNAAWCRFQAQRLVG